MQLIYIYFNEILFEDQGNVFYNLQKDVYLNKINNIADMVG